MTTARASHLRLVVTEPVVPVVRQPRLRFRPVVRLADGEAFGLNAEADISFEDTFQPRHLSDATLPSAAGWLGDLIERAGRLAQDTGAHHRPLSISAPMAALADKDAPMAAEAGAAYEEAASELAALRLEHASLLETNAAAATPAPIITNTTIRSVVRVTAQMLKRQAESAFRSPAIALSATLPKPRLSAGSKIFSAPFKVSSAS